VRVVLSVPDCGETTTGAPVDVVVVSDDVVCAAAMPLIRANAAAPASRYRVMA
jgi:hypothetical protein